MGSCVASVYFCPVWLSINLSAWHIFTSVFVHACKVIHTCMHLTCTHNTAYMHVLFIFVRYTYTNFNYEIKMAIYTEDVLSWCMHDKYM